jgi:hypothetical protein
MNKWEENCSSVWNAYMIRGCAMILNCSHDLMALSFSKKAKQELNLGKRLRHDLRVYSSRLVFRCWVLRSSRGDSYHFSFPRPNHQKLRCTDIRLGLHSSPLGPEFRFLAIDAVVKSSMNYWPERRTHINGEVIIFTIWARSISLCWRFNFFSVIRS